MQGDKVISSDITRDHKPLQNNLYDLIRVKPAISTSAGDVKEQTCNFQPIIGKIYTPKKRFKFAKVKTVRDIRNIFETDISTDLAKELEKQQNLLLKKITCGSSREENTKGIARNMLKCDKPVSRSAWQMLMNVNPEGHPHAMQCVLWNNRRIRVNGSKGGKHRFLSNYDLANVKIRVKKETKRRSFYMKKGLLQNSLAVKFKPGPLSRKKFLDDSFQKYNVGKTELVNLPKPGLDIQPAYGVSLEPIVANFVQSLRDCNGTISEKWAEFAVSVIGTVKNNEAIQNSTESGVTFELNYKRNQRRMLLRRDVKQCETSGSADSDTVEVFSQVNNELCIISDVKNILEKLIDSVEISLQQDSMYTGEDEPRELPYKETVNVHNAIKDKGKKKYCELDRLDVTVIRLPDIAVDDDSKTCKNAHCLLGCICASLHCSYQIKQHCNRLECMFECQCDFSKYKISDALDNDCPELIPGLINLDNKLSMNLAKEEQKFHQTVVLTGEKSILLKSQKRNWKATKKYSDFYESMCLKNDLKCQQMLSVVVVKLSCDNVEPWCMVHNLYRCFCKGKFTEKANTNSINENVVNETTPNQNESVPAKRLVSDFKDNKNNLLERNSTEKYSVSQCSQIIDLDSRVGYNYTTCARTRPYKGRKYYDVYYLNTNKKIIEMEKNDHHLRRKMLSILNKTEDETEDTNNQATNTIFQTVNIMPEVQESIKSNDENSSSGSITEAIQTTISIESQDSDSMSANFKSECNVTPDRSMLNSTSNKAKLIAWLESSYKQYKRRIEQGIVKKSLDPPKHGKVALYPWEFILSRYRERKNLFFISLDKPFRIFMAVDGKNSFFNNCINIDDIRFADLHKYPVTVTNLLTNATELKDNFCILCGLSHCWELIGSVTKLDDQTNDTNQLQSVADDKAIGFIAQDNKEISKVTTTDENDIKNSQINFVVKDDSAAQPEGNNMNDELGSSSKKKGKKRRRKFGKPKNALDKKSKATTINEDTIDQGAQDKIKDNSNDELEDTDSGTNTSTTYDQDQQNLSTEQSLKFMSIPVTANKQTLLVQELPETKSNDEVDSQSSKWFVMTVENDFTEIQFYNRGFFVKYESIIKAINVARMSGKTVRLSSQKGGDSSNSPQFGIYAIPNSNEYYVFIGPYEKNEPLGIETVKSFANMRKLKTTRGVWITTNKVDNVKVIDNPLSFMPTDVQSSKIVSLENEVMQNQMIGNDEETIKPNTNLQITASKRPVVIDNTKTVKPIKIRKTNGFYQLASQGYFRQVLPKPPEVTPKSGGNIANSLLQPILFKNVQTDRQPVRMPVLQLPLPSLCYTQQQPQTVLKNIKYNDCLPQNAKPVAEIAPQIKILDVYSEKASQSQSNNLNSSKKVEGSMFILKPEEINKRLMENRLASNSEQAIDKIYNKTVSDLDQDIENFLKTSAVYVPPNADIYEISDEDEDSQSALGDWRQVWIECETAILGYIKGKKNADNLLSFEFPGFKYSDFYPEEEAFSKINQVLSRKIYVPKSIKLKWRVVDSVSCLKIKYELNSTFLGPDFVLTKNGIRHKLVLMGGSKSFLKNEVDNCINLTNEMEERSKKLEDESDKMLTEIAQIDRTTLLESLSIAKNTDKPQYSEKRDQLSKTLHDIIMDNT